MKRLGPGGNQLSPIWWPVIALLIIVTVFPFYWLIRMSFTPNVKIFTAPASLAMPQTTLSNFARVLGMVDSKTAVSLGGSGQKINFLRFVFNSLFVSTIVTISQVFFSSLAAFAFARLRFPGKNIIFSAYLSTLMIPGIVLILPNFVLMKELGWLNKFIGIMAPAMLMTPFAVFFLRQFFMGINRELEESAHLDGAGKIRIFFQIILPLSQTALATIAVVTFINEWNDYLWPLIVGRSESVRQLTVALGVFRSQTPQGAPDWGGLTAATLLAILPSVALYIALGKRIVNAIGFTGFR
jgi:multiple sugar transport system permease protein